MNGSPILNSIPFQHMSLIEMAYIPFMTRVQYICQMDIYIGDLTILVNGLHKVIIRPRETTQQLLVGNIHWYWPERARYNSIRKGWYVMDIYRYNLNIIAKRLHKVLLIPKVTTDNSLFGEIYWYIARNNISSLSICF